MFLGTYKSFLGVEGQAAKMRQRGLRIQQQWKVLGAGISAARAGSQAYQEVDKLQKEAIQIAARQADQLAIFDE